MQFISKVRFLFGSLNEEMRMHKKDFVLEKPTLMDKRISNKKDKRLRTKKETLARLNELMQQKFNFGKNAGGTRESKAFSQNKLMHLLSNCFYFLGNWSMKNSFCLGQLQRIRWRIIGLKSFSREFRIRFRFLKLNKGWKLRIRFWSLGCPNNDSTILFF